LSNYTSFGINVYFQDPSVARNIETMSLEIEIWLWLNYTLIQCMLNEWTWNSAFSYIEHGTVPFLTLNPYGTVPFLTLNMEQCLFLHWTWNSAFSYIEHGTVPFLTLRRPILWCHEKVVKQRTFHATSRHSFITMWWYNVLNQTGYFSLISKENLHNVR
jgi:hypothetical protein